MAAEALEKQLLQILDKYGQYDSYVVSTELGIDHQAVVGSLKSISSLGSIISLEQKQTERWVLSEEGKDIAELGSHEFRIFSAVPPTGLLQTNLQSLGPTSKIGFSKAMSEGWLMVDKSAPDGPKIFRKVEFVEDLVQSQLRQVALGSSSLLDDKKLEELKKRKLIYKEVIKSFVVTKGIDFTLQISKLDTDLTSEMINSASWKTKKFKEYNFLASGIPFTVGCLHPLLKVRSQFKQIFLDMGFTEMPTNSFVESSFWNFDSLFQPQQHPARDAHDTFFLSDPKEAKLESDPEYIQRVKGMHESGGYGSTGYKYHWKMEEARKNILRTHTTAVSSRMLYMLARQDKFTPKKYFSIDRVFRNEATDATHLAEFHQVEGLYADYNLTLGCLIGILYQFFNKLGMKKLRFKPAYNPYTEPSMEVFSYHEGLKKWVEVGNSGVFRPEMLRPMGLPEHVSVIAWGLSLERPTMIKYGIQNIRDLFGHKVDLSLVARNPICRIDY